MIESLPTVEVEHRDDVVLVTLRRPPANALDPDLVGDVVTVLDALEADLPRGVVLAGSEGFFCAGADLRLVPDLSPDDQASLARGVSRMFSGWHQLPRPVVTAVTGHAVAGGFVLALCGDQRVVSTSGRFGLTEVKVGIPYPSAAMAVVKAELDPPVARRLVLRGELHDADTMVELGAFDEVVPDGEVVDRAVAMAEELAAHPPTTYGLVKRRLRSPVGAGGDFGGAAEAARATEEAKVAARRVLEDRPDR